MGFTVTRAGETKDIDFEAYLRLLRQQGVDLGHVPRVPEPDTKRRWLYVWDSEAKARAFAKELKKRTGGPAWKVIPVNGSPSEGPMGPILIQLADRGDRLYFGVDSLSQAMLESAFPKAFGVDSVCIYTERWYEFRKTRGTLADFVKLIAPTITGLSLEQLEALGYTVIDDQSHKTLVFVPPAEVAQASGDSPAAVASDDGQNGGS
jgi:hypothetical protein